MNAFHVAARADDLEGLAFLDALLRARVYINDIAVCVAALFVFFESPDDFRHVRKGLVANVTGAIELGSVSDALFLLCARDNEFSTLLSLGVGSEGECWQKGERQQQCFEVTEPWHIWSPLVNLEKGSGQSDVP